MSTLPYRFEELTAARLEAFIAAQPTEGITLELKSEPYGGNDDAVREFLKDVTSLANTSGGFLLIGVREVGGVATELAPIESPDADKMKQRLESLLQSAVEPRIFGVRLAPVVFPSGYVLVIQVPRSPTSPHRVTARGSNRFWLRSSAGAYEASMDELRNMFSQSMTARDRLLKFRDQRLQLIADGLTYPLATPERLNLHIVPLSSQGFSVSVNLTKAYDLNYMFRPIGDHGGWSPVYNFDGFANVTGSPPHGAYTQVFRDGSLEAVASFLLGHADAKIILAKRVVKDLAEAAPSYVDALRDIGVSPPLFLLVTLVGVQNASLTCGDGDGFGRALPKLTAPKLALPICVIEDYGTPASYRARLKPAFDALWNAGGRSEWQG